MKDFTTGSQSVEEQAPQKLAFPNFLLHIGGFWQVVEHRGGFKIMKCYTLLTTNAIYTSLNYYDDAPSLPLTLWPYLKYLDNKHLQKQKEKRENSVLQKPRTTLLNYSLEYLVNFFVINLIFYSKNC